MSSRAPSAEPGASAPEAEAGPGRAGLGFRLVHGAEALVWLGLAGLLTLHLVWWETRPGPGPHGGPVTVALATLLSASILAAAALVSAALRPPGSEGWTGAVRTHGQVALLALLPWSLFALGYGGHGVVREGASAVALVAGVAASPLLPGLGLLLASRRARAPALAGAVLTGLSLLLGWASFLFLWVCAAAGFAA